MMYNFHHTSLGFQGTNDVIFVTLFLLSFSWGRANNICHCH